MKEPFQDNIKIAADQLAKEIAKNVESTLVYKLNWISAEAYRNDQPILRKLLDKLSHSVLYKLQEDIADTIEALRDEGFTIQLEYKEPTISITPNYSSCKN